MSSIEQYNGGITAGLVSRRAGRELTHIHERSAVTRAAIEAEADVQASIVDGIAAVTVRAMQDVALVSQIEQSLAQTTPHASGRLATIADMASVGMSEVVVDTARRLRRCS